YDPTAIDGTDNAVDLHVSVGSHRDLGDLCEIAAERIQNRHAAALTFGEWAPPSCLLRGQVEHRAGARYVFKQRAPVIDRVLPGCGGQLVDEALDDKTVVRRADAAPPSRHQARGLLADAVNEQVRKRVGSRCGLCGVRIKSVLQ